MFGPVVPCRTHGACRDVVHHPIVDPSLPRKIDYADYLRQTNRQMPLIAPVPLPPSDPRFEPVPIRTPPPVRPVEAPAPRVVEQAMTAGASGAPKLGDLTQPTPPPPLRRIERIVERHAPAATGKLIDLIA